jgi:hypothetical protein
VREGVKNRMAWALVGLAEIVGKGRGFTQLRRVSCNASIVGQRVNEVKLAFKLAGVDLALGSWELSEPTLGRGEGTPEPELELSELDDVGRGGPWLDIDGLTFDTTLGLWSDVRLCSLLWCSSVGKNGATVTRLVPIC